MAGVLWKDEAEIDVQAYGIAIDPGQFIICWTCHFSATDAPILREHLSEAHRSVRAVLELNRPGERMVKRDDLTEDDIRRAAEVSALAREHAVDISSIDAADRREDRRS